MKFLHLYNNFGVAIPPQVDNYAPVTYTFPVKASDDAQFDNIQHVYVGKNETMLEGFVGCISRVEFDDIYPIKFLFQQDGPDNIMVESGEFRPFKGLAHLCRPVRSTFAVRETASLGQQMLERWANIINPLAH